MSPLERTYAFYAPDEDEDEDYKYPLKRVLSLGGWRVHYGS